MKSQRHRKSTSELEVLNISKNGIWLLVSDREYFMPFDQYPWFRDATVSEIHNVELLSGTHLRWADLDVDLEVESLDKPGSYPLIYKK
jgi:hypothetical protein